MGPPLIQLRLSLLVSIEKILEKDMQCLDKDKVRIVGFLLEVDACKWWVHKQTTKRHT